MIRLYIRNLKVIFLIAALVITVLNSRHIYSATQEDIIHEQKEIRTQHRLEQKATDESPGPVQAGQKTYENACAICHGVNGKGKGIYTSQIIQQPSDLTRLAVNNGGVFPFEYAYAVIDGREKVISHGPREMPIWGDQFSHELWLDVPSSFIETGIRGKIFELLLYLNSIQNHN